MPFGYAGQNQPNQTVSNSGVFSITDVAELQSQGKLGGSLELIEEQTFSAVSTVEFTNIKESGYKIHRLDFNNIDASSNQNNRLHLDLSTDNGTSWDNTSGNYYFAYQYGSASGVFGAHQSSTTGDKFNVVYGYPNFNASMYLYNLGSSSDFTMVTNIAPVTQDSASYFFYIGGGFYNSKTINNGIRFYYANATYTLTGSATLYGVKEVN